MKVLSCVLLFLATLSLQAQDLTYDKRRNDFLGKRGGLGSLAIIPYESKMYMSDADAPIGRETGLNPGELSIKFRNAVVGSLEESLSVDWSISTIYESAEQESGFGLEFVHSGVKYEFIPIDEDVLIENDTTLNRKDVRSKQKGKSGKSGIHEGQVRTASDQSERFMHVLIENDTLLNYLEHDLNADYYLFINEFDIRHHIVNPDKIALGGGLAYRLKVHFSCLDRNGNVFVAGAATSDVKAPDKDIYQVIADGIPELTDKITRMIRKRGMKKAD